MTAHVRDAGAWATIADIYVKDAGTWKTVQEGWVKDAGTWKQFHGSGGGGGGGSLTVAPVSVATVLGQSGGFAQAGNVTSSAGDVEYTVTGYTGALTYSWSRVSGPSMSGAFYITGPSSAQPTWTRYVSDSDYAIETWRLTVTDSLGNTGTLDFSIELQWTNLL